MYRVSFIKFMSNQHAAFRSDSLSSTDERRYRHVQLKLLRSCDTCEEDLVTLWALANKNWDIWESHVYEVLRGHSDRQRAEGNYNDYIQPKGTTATGRKRQRFFRVHYGTQGGCCREIQGIPPHVIKCLSKCEWETDEVCTACTTNKAEPMPFIQLFSNPH
jgi:hypothetical protein